MHKLLKLKDAHVTICFHCEILALVAYNIEVTKGCGLIKVYLVEKLICSYKIWFLKFTSTTCLTTDQKLYLPCNAILIIIRYLGAPQVWLELAHSISVPKNSLFLYITLTTNNPKIIFYLNFYIYPKEGSFDN